MDIVTQGLAGAVLAQSFSKKSEARAAMVVGFLAGLLADIDAIFTQSNADPLFQLEFHRHFTHSIFFIPIGGLLAALLLWPLAKKHLPFKRTLLFTTMGYGTSGIIDACTSYGTYLLWPLSDERISWNVISIFDPVFSFALILAIAYAAVKRRPQYAMAGVSIAMLYLSVGFYQHDRAEAMAMQLAKERGHQVERIEIKPTMANLVLWRSIYEAAGYFHVDAFRPAMITDARVYKGERIKRFEVADLPELRTDSIMAADIKRFDYFSDGYIALRGNVLGDIRYSMVPTSTRPIWGIELNMTVQDQHTPFNQYHNTSELNRKLFIAMVIGDELERSTSETNTITAAKHNDLLSYIEQQIESNTHELGG